MHSGLIKKTGTINNKGKGIIPSKPSSSNTQEKLYDLVYWNAVQKCDPDNCGCVELCSKVDIGKPCSVLSSYMGGVFDMMIRTFPGEISEDVIYRIGMHLVPLYKILCRLKMQEFSETQVVISNGKLGRHINPIFEEIRKTIVVIEKTWQNLGYIVKDERKKRNRFVGNFNDRNYYDVIENGGMPMLDEMHTDC